MFHRHLLLTLVATTVLLGGCLNLAVTKDAVIKNMIRGGLQSRDEVMRNGNGLIADYKVYRDGEADGVVFEYIYARDVQVDRAALNPEAIKAEMLPMFRENAETRKVLNMGIYTRLVYTSAAGEVIAQAKITADDL